MQNVDDVIIVEIQVGIEIDTSEIEIRETVYELITYDGICIVTTNGDKIGVMTGP